MKVQLLYFAWVREGIGLDGETADPPAHVETIADLIGWLADRGGGYAEAFKDPARIRAAIDQAFVKPEAPIAGAKEIALFPPVTGG